MYSMVWAVNILFNDSADTHNAFLITMGHELTHKEKSICPLIYIYRTPWCRFVAWTNEVHCDFNGARIFADSSREKLLQSMKYKLAYNENNGVKDTGDGAHPSWKQRIHYAEKYDFREDLIRKIAEDAGCHNEHLIRKVCTFFEDIKLE